MPKGGMSSKMLAKKATEQDLLEAQMKMAKKSRFKDEILTQINDYKTRLETKQKAEQLDDKK